MSSWLAIYVAYIFILDVINQHKIVINRYCVTQIIALFADVLMFALDKLYIYTLGYISHVTLKNVFKAC